MKLSSGHIGGLLAAWLLATLSESVTAHSWPQQTRRLAPNGTIIGDPGYDRAHVDGDAGNVWLIPPNGRSDGKVIHPDDKIARDSKKSLDGAYSSKFPKLKVAPGDFAAILYTENGHVTAPDKANPFKPINRGTVYLYGTTHNDLSNTNLVDVHLKWTADGTGGDGKGKLLATRNYDDGQCHETLPASGDNEGILTYRKKFVSKVDTLICQSDVQVPEDIPVGQILTVIWVWDWPDMNVQGVAVPPASYYTNSSDSGQPFVKTPEIYTGVVDFEIVDPCDDSLGELKGPTCKTQKVKVAAQFDAQQAATTRGIRAQMMNPFMVKVPQAGFEVSAATADPTNIPMHPLIGVLTALLPLPSSILEAQNQYFAAPTTTASTTKTAPSSSSKPTPTSTKNKQDGVVIVTVTVPERIVTVTVTGDRSSSSSSSTAATTSAALPTVTQFLSSSRRARVRRVYR